MIFPTFGTIKTYAMIGLSLALAVVAALLGFEKAGRAKDKLDDEIKARKAEQADTKITSEGLANEQKEIDKARINNPKRDDFE